MKLEFGAAPLLGPERRAGCASQLAQSPPFFPSGCPWQGTSYRVYDTVGRTMSCCGTPRPQDKIVSGVGTRSVAAGGLLQQSQQQPFPVSQQPEGHPGISPFPLPINASSSFRPPEITPPALVYPMGHINGTAHSPPPTASTMHTGSVPPSSPQQMGMYTSASPPVILDPNRPLSPLRRPTPTYPASGSSNILSTYQSPVIAPSSLPPIDEGKVSVSIDFGERRPSLTTTPRSKLTDSWFRNYLLWRGECNLHFRHDS